MRLLEFHTTVGAGKRGFQKREIRHVRDLRESLEGEATGPVLCPDRGLPYLARHGGIGASHRAALRRNAIGFAYARLRVDRSPRQTRVKIARRIGTDIKYAVICCFRLGSGRAGIHRRPGK